MAFGKLHWSPIEPTAAQPPRPAVTKEDGRRRRKGTRPGPRRAKECGRPGCGHLELRHGPGCEFCACPAMLARLTPRELQVLKVLAQGLGAKGAAQELNLSVDTIEAHVNHMQVKTGAHSTLALILAALRAGILTLAELPDAGGIELAGPTRAGN